MHGKRKIAITAGLAVLAAAGVTIGLVSTSGGSTGTSSASSGGAPGAPGGGGAQGANARSTNDPGGTSGTVSAVSGTGFTVTTTVGEKFTVTGNASTAYAQASGTSAAASTATTAGAVTAGEGVLVLGTVNGTAITATQVTVEPAGSAYTTASADVSAMQRGQQNTSQSYGTIPSDYTEGQGTIVGASTSDKAVASALAKYPGGIVDRVVQLADGDYEVHDIGTSMHHIFENSSFQVIGAD